MKKFIYPFLAFAVVLFLLISFNVNFKDKQGRVLSSTITVPENQERTLNPEELNDQYQEAAKSIVPILGVLATPISDHLDLEKRLETASRIKETIFDLKVPGQYQNLHLDLVSITDGLESLFLERQRLETDQDIGEQESKIDFREVEEEINKMINDYPWLKDL